MHLTSILSICLGMALAVPVWVGMRSASAERIEVGFRARDALSSRRRLRVIRSRPCYDDPYFQQVLHHHRLEDCASFKATYSSFSSAAPAGGLGNLGGDLWLLGLGMVKPGNMFAGPLTPWTQQEACLFAQYLSPKDFFAYTLTDFWVVGDFGTAGCHWDCLKGGFRGARNKA